MSNPFENWTITSIESIQLYDSSMEVVKKNVPDDIKVSHTKFKRFCRHKDLKCRNNTSGERTVYFDNYDNLVAYFVWGRKPDNKGIYCLIKYDVVSLGKHG